MNTTPARINPRIRERRIEVQREAGRRRLRVLLVVSSVLSVVGLVFLGVTSPIVAVDHIRVEGAQHVTAAQVVAASGVHYHDHMLFVDAGAAARRVEELPWVERASVKRSLPNTLRITVDEYTPAAYVRVAGGVMLVAANGHVITRATAVPPHTVEVLGVRSAPAPGDVLAPADAAGVVARLPAALALPGRRGQRRWQRSRTRARRRRRDPSRRLDRPRRESRVGGGGAGASRDRALHLRRRVDTRSSRLARVSRMPETPDAARRSD